MTVLLENAEYAELVGQRDMLLAALIRITRTVVDQSTFIHDLDEIEQALKAIAKATGKSTFGNDWMSALDQQGDAP